MLVLSDGSVPVSETDVHGHDVVGRLPGVDLERAWHTLLLRRATDDSFRILRP